MFLSIGSALSLFYGLDLLFGHRFRKDSTSPCLIKEISNCLQGLITLSEQLRAGLYPEEAAWSRLRNQNTLWSKAIFSVVDEQRVQGLPLLPLLESFEGFLRQLQRDVETARAKTAGVLGQAVACLCMIPVLAFFFWLILPEVSESTWTWVVVSFFATLLGVGALVWIFQLVRSVRSLGLPREIENLTWVYPLFLVRLSGAIQGGHSPDWAWRNSTEIIFTGVKQTEGAKNLLIAAGLLDSGTLWEGSPVMPGKGFHFDLGVRFQELRKKLLQSFLDGVGALAPVENERIGYEAFYRTQMEERIQRLPTQALKPLFLCIAPALFLELGAGLWMVLRSSI